MNHESAFHKIYCRFYSTSNFKQTLLLSLVLVALLFGAFREVRAAEPKRFELTELVGDKVGLTIEVRGLTEQAEKIRRSDVAQRVQQHSAWLQILNSAELLKLKEVNASVRQATGRPILDWLDTILGREAILAISPQGNARQPGFVLLTRLKKSDEMDSILTAWNQLDHRQETRLEFQGQAYYSRTKNGESGEVLYYALIGDVAVLSDQKDALTATLGLAGGRRTGSRLADLPTYQKSLQLLNPTATLRVFIQPAVWKTDVAIEETPSRDAGERLIQQAWMKSQAVGVGIRFESGVIAEAIVLSDDLAKNEMWHKFVERTRGSPAFLARVPRTALMAFGGRHDLSGLSEWGLRHLPADRLKQFKSIRQMVKGVLLGRDLLDDILPQLPVDFGAFIVPRRDLDLKAAPVDGLIAVSLPEKEALEMAPSKASLRNALNNGAQTGFSLLTTLYNSSSDPDADLKEEDQNGISIHWIESIGPYRPAYAVSEDALLLASSPQLIRDFLKQSVTETWGSDSELRKFRDACFADASQVLAVHGRMAREFVVENRQFFVQQLVSAHQLTPAEANKRLDRMLEWVQLSDVVVLATTFSNDHIKVVLGLAVEAAPKK